MRARRGGVRIAETCGSLFVLIAFAFLTGMALLVFFGIVYYIDHVVRRRRDWRRDQAFRKFLNELEYDYIGGMTGYGTDLLGYSYIYGSQLSKAIHGITFSYEGIPVTSFVWLCKSQDQKKYPMMFQVLSARVGFKKRGKLELRKEFIEDKVKKKFDENYLDFELKDFNEKYYVTASPRKFGYDFFTPRMIRLFMKKKYFRVIIRRDHLVIYKQLPNKAFIYNGSDVKDFNDLVKWIDNSMEMMMNVLRLMPHYLVAFKIEPEEPVLPQKERMADRGAVIRTGKVSIKITCSVCSKKFRVSGKPKKATCPRCGVSGSLIRLF